MTRAVIVAQDGVLADEVRLARDVLERLPGVRVTIAGPRRGALASANGVVVADVTHAEVLLADVVVVPGMLGVSSVAADERFIAWLRHLVSTAEWTLSLSVGGVAVAATGRVQGELATSWLAGPLLERFGVTAATERVTSEGRILSASGTVSAFDALGELARRIAGDDVAAAVLAEVRAAAAGEPDRVSARRWRWRRWVGVRLRPGTPLDRRTG